MVKKVVLITTGQPSINPRIVKEADTLSLAGYDVLVLYCFVIMWAEEKDIVLLSKVSWKYQMVGGSPGKQKITYFLTRLRCKIAGILNRNLGNYALLAERSQARAYDELLSVAKSAKADWYIGHNLGALAIAAKAAKFNGGKAGFDFEDYHRGEITADNEMMLRRIIFLENKYLPLLHYYSTASEMITRATENNHPTFRGKTTTILNCFPLSQQPAFIDKPSTDSRLHLFWFSQKIGMKRGLQVLIKAMQLLKDPSIELTLVGRCDPAIMDFLKEHANEMLNQIHFAGLLQPEEIPAFAARFDVGMAIEVNDLENRDLCLTNKIFTYLLAGNALVLSDTLMQAEFNDDHHVGVLFSSRDEKDLAEKIIYYKDVALLNKQKKYNYHLAKDIFNWEKESEKLIAVLQ